MNCGFRSLKGKASIVNPETSFFLSVTKFNRFFSYQEEQNKKNTKEVRSKWVL